MMTDKSMKEIILASKSPRRIEMLKKAGFNLTVTPASVDESLPFDLPPESATMYLAFLKAFAVYESLTSSGSSGSLLPILAADTVVVHDGKIIGKPADVDEAFATLANMRNDVHRVITGCCVISEENKHCFYDETFVHFGNYSDEELNQYVSTDEPYDKAGGYAIQGTFSKYVDHFDGDLDNVIGLPLHLVLKYL